MRAEEYKKLTIKEFDRAAGQFDNDDPSVYNMCRKDYPDILAEIKKEPFNKLLDCGCGTGAMIGLLAKDVPGKEYHGIDLSELNCHWPTLWEKVMCIAIPLEKYEVLQLRQDCRWRSAKSERECGFMRLCESCKNNKQNHT